MHAAFGIQVGRIVGRGADAQVGIVEQAHVVLGAQHVAYRAVDLGHGDLARFHQARQFLEIQRVGHAHVHARLDGEPRGFAVVVRHAMADQFGDGAVVADGDAAKAPVLAQQVLQQPGVGAGGDAVDGVQRHHHAAGAGVDGRAVGWQVVLVHAQRAHVDHVVVAAAFDRAVQREMLDAGHDAVGARRRRALVALDGGPRDARDEIGVLAEAFRGAAPARIARDVDHGREGHVQAVGGGFDRGHARGAFDGAHVPARSQAQADGEDGPVAVHDVIGEEQRDAQAALPGGILHHAVVDVDHRVERAADAAGRDLLGDLLARHVGADADQAQLADLLVQRHLRHQVGDEGFFVVQ